MALLLLLPPPTRAVAAAAAVAPLYLARAYIDLLVRLGQWLMSRDLGGWLVRGREGEVYTQGGVVVREGG